jgi:hypothetical protein
VLDKLMRLVGEEEEKWKRETNDELEGLHSFWPQFYPRNVCRPSAGEEYDSYHRAKGRAEELKALRLERGICHVITLIIFAELALARKYT